MDIIQDDDKLDLRCRFDVLTRPNGSVIYSEDETTVMVGIYGPVECKISKVLTDRAYIEMNYRPKSGFPSVRDRFYESVIKNTCDTAVAAASFPRASIVITVQEMHDNGRLISSAINATCLACLESGIDMRFMFASTTCFLTKERNFLSTTPSDKNNIIATFVFVFDSVKGRVIVSHTEGTFSTSEYEKALEKCRMNSKAIFKFIEEKIIKRIKGSEIE